MNTQHIMEGMVDQHEHDGTAYTA
jgi:hypothetical protein